MRFAAAIGLFTALQGHAQWEVPVPIALDGPAPEHRQVTGLADPAAPSAGVSVDAARTNATTYAIATGTSVLVADLLPAPSALMAGLSVVIVPQEANTGGAQLQLNGLPAAPIIKLGGLPLDSADLTPGSPHRLVYDGQSFRLISSTYLGCPAGFKVGAREFCIADSAQTELTYFEAMNACAAVGARLCSFAEWIHGCQSNPAFLGTVLDAEWVDSGANDANTAKIVGFGGDGGSAPVDFGCNRGYHRLPTLTARFRCCTSR